MGSNTHPTTIPKQLQRVDSIDNPLSDHDDSEVIRRFVNEYRENRDGLLYRSHLYLLHEELVDRGISPVTVLRNHGHRP